MTKRFMETGDVHQSEKIVEGADVAPKDPNQMQGKLPISENKEEDEDQPE